MVMVFFSTVAMGLFPITWVEPVDGNDIDTVIGCKTIPLFHENRSKFGRADNLDPLKLWKREVPLVAGDDVLCSGFLGTLQEPVVRLIGRCADRAGGMHQEALEYAQVVFLGKWSTTDESQSFVVRHSLFSPTGC